MARIVYLVMGIVAINVALLLFSCTYWDPSTGACTEVPASSIWNLVLSLASGDITSSTLWSLLFTAGLLSVGATLIFIGSFFLKVEFPLFAAMAAGLALPVYSWTKFFSHVANTRFFDGNPLAGTIVAILIASPIIITYIFTILDWARGRD